MRSGLLSDGNGLELRCGDLVRILTIDSSLLATLPQEERDLVLSLTGTVCAVQEIADGGFVVVERTWRVAADRLTSQSISLAPNEFELVSPLPSDMGDTEIEVLGCLLNGLESVEAIYTHMSANADEALTRERIQHALVTAQRHGYVDAGSYLTMSNEAQNLQRLDNFRLDSHYWVLTGKGRHLFGLEGIVP